jgi:hypothetical protein
MAPEQVLGEDVDGRADVYAVGLILYRLLAGRLPFDAVTPMAMLQKHVAETPPPLETYRGDLPAWCDILVQRALAKAPNDRFQTAEEFRGAVGRAIGLTPAVDLAKAFAVSDTKGSTDVTAPPPVETIAISRSEAGLPPVPAGAEAWWSFKNTPMQWSVGAAILAGFCALGALAYLTGGASATRAGTGRSSDTRTEERIPAIVDPGESGAPSSRSGGSRPTSGSIAAAPPESPGASTKTGPLVFRAKLVRTQGRERREDDARLTFTRERLSVTMNRVPDEPVLSVPYGHLTVIEHSRKSGWKPPQKWSKVVKIEDDVLKTFGIRDRHEISLRTNSDFVLLRVDEQIVNRVLRTLEDRTGLSAQLSSAR